MNLRWIPLPHIQQTIIRRYTDEQHTSTFNLQNHQNMHSLVVEEAYSTSRGFFAILGGGSRRFRTLLADCRGPNSSHAVSSAVSLQATVGQRLKHPRATIYNSYEHNTIYCIVFSYRFLKFKIRVFCCPGNRAREIRKRFIINCHRIRQTRGKNKKYGKRYPSSTSKQPIFGLVQNKEFLIC